MFPLVVVGGIYHARNTCQSENTENDEEKETCTLLQKYFSTFLQEKPKVAVMAINTWEVLSVQSVKANSVFVVCAVWLNFVFHLRLQRVIKRSPFY